MTSDTDTITLTLGGLFDKTLHTLILNQHLLSPEDAEKVRNEITVRRIVAQNKSFNEAVAEYEAA